MAYLDDTAAADIQDIIAIEKSSDGEDSSSLEDEDAIDLFEGKRYWF